MKDILEPATSSFRRLISGKQSGEKLKGIRRINLCGGPVIIDGYVNIDIGQGADLVHDIRKPLPLPSDSVEIVVMSHALNYFTYDECKSIVSEIYRILKTGGIVRVSVPDLELFAKAYIEKDREFLFQKLPSGADRFRGATIGDKFISLAYGYGGVKYFFDYESCAVIFRLAGFKNIKRCNYGESAIPDIQKIDNRPELSFYLEAVK